MTIAEMLGQGGAAAALGIGIIVGILVIIIGAFHIAGKSAPSSAPENKPVMPARPGPSAAGGENKSAITAAITAAVNEYRTTKSN